jgi:hypothetical protein
MTGKGLTMEQPLIICSTEVDSYEKHCELLNAGYQLQKCGNSADIYVHKEMPNLHEMKVGKKISSSYREPDSEEFILHLKNAIASSKAIKLLSNVTHTIFNARTTLYELARMIAPKNHNIAIHKSIDGDNQTDDVAMTEKLTPTQLSK